MCTMYVYPGGLPSSGTTPSAWVGTRLASTGGRAEALLLCTSCTHQQRGCRPYTYHEVRPTPGDSILNC
eukprot:scaffold292425_cov44-Tisochrysis_lutea.AAC.1